MPLFDDPLRRCRLAIVAVAFASTIVGCAGQPELRVAGEGETTASIAAGKRLLEQGRAADSVAAFRRHLRTSGPSLQALNGLAIAYGELGRRDLAAEMFSRALALSPDDPATLNNIGFAALRRADSRLARHYLAKARAQGAGLDEIDGNLQRLALLEAFDRRSRSGDAPRLTDIAIAAAAPAAHLAVAPAEVRDEPTVERTNASPSALIDFAALADPFVPVTSFPPSPETTPLGDRRGLDTVPPERLKSELPQ